MRTRCILTPVNKTSDSNREALARAVVEASKTIQAKCIFVITQTGETASDISKFRPNVPVKKHTLTFGICLYFSP